MSSSARRAANGASSPALLRRSRRGRELPPRSREVARLPVAAQPPDAAAARRDRRRPVRAARTRRQADAGRTHVLGEGESNSVDRGRGRGGGARGDGWKDRDDRDRLRAGSDLCGGALDDRRQAPETATASEREAPADEQHRTMGGAAARRNRVRLRQLRARRFVASERRAGAHADRDPAAKRPSPGDETEAQGRGSSERINTDGVAEVAPAIARRHYRGGPCARRRTEPGAGNFRPRGSLDSRRQWTRLDVRGGEVG